MWKWNNSGTNTVVCVGRWWYCAEGFLNLPKWFPPKDAFLLLLKPVWKKSLDFQFYEKGFIATQKCGCDHRNTISCIFSWRFNCLFSRILCEYWTQFVIGPLTPVVFSVILCHMRQVCHRLCKLTSRPELTVLHSIGTFLFYVFSLSCLIHLLHSCCWINIW